MVENWKPCVGYLGYEVSDLGRVRSPTKLLKIEGVGSHGYPQAQLGKGNVRTVHSLVLEAFRGPRPAGMESCHGDGNKLNATLSNLRWDTPKANTGDKYRHGTAGANYTSDSGRAAVIARHEKDTDMLSNAKHSVEEMARAGCTTSRGIRYWEERALLGDVARSEGDTRRYTDEQMDRARIIAAAQFGGFEIETIGEMLKNYDREVHSAIMTRLSDQVRAAARLAENLPAPVKPEMEYDL